MHVNKAGAGGGGRIGEWTSWRVMLGLRSRPGMRF